MTIAEEGTIIGASRKLHMTQPALSQQLKSLEYDLGKNLFDRQGKKLILNEFGKLVRDYATRIFRQSEEMIQVLSSENMEFTKVLKVGCLPWVPKNLIYEFIRPTLINPYIKIDTTQSTVEDLVGQLKSHQLDLVLADAPYTGRSKKFVSQRLMSEPIICVCSSKTRIRGTFPEVVNGKRIVNFPMACLSSAKVEQFLERNNLETQQLGEFNDLELSYHMVVKGAALGFFPESFVKESLKLKRLRKLGELEKMKYSLWVITRKDLKKEGLISSVIKEFGSV